MNAALWVVQTLLALAFAAVGGMHLTLPHATLATMMAWVGSAPYWLPRFIGAMEVLGAIGLVGPAAIRLVPWLTPLAAALLGLMMLLAAALHWIRAELSNGIPSLVLLVACTFVAVGRVRLARVQSRRLKASSTV